MRSINWQIILGTNSPKEQKHQMVLILLLINKKSLINTKNVRLIQINNDFVSLINIKYYYN